MILNQPRGKGLPGLAAEEIEQDFPEGKERQIESYTQSIARTLDSVKEPKQRREVIQKKLDNMQEIESDREVVREMRVRFRGIIRDQILEIEAGTGREIAEGGLGKEEGE